MTEPSFFLGRLREYEGVLCAFAKDAGRNGRSPCNSGVARIAAIRRWNQKMNPQKELDNCFSCGERLWRIKDTSGEEEWTPICRNCGADQNKAPGCCEGGAAPDRPDVPCE